MDSVKQTLGGFFEGFSGGGSSTSAPAAPAAKTSDSLETLQAIRGLNRDWVELGCGSEKHASTQSLPCLNLLDAMRRLSLPAPAPTTGDPAVALGPPTLAQKPPTLVLQKDAEAQAACVKRCGVFGSVLGATLATAAISTNAVADLGVAEPQRDVVAQASAAAASVAVVALCARLCEPGSKQKTFDGEGAYVLEGKYSYVADTKSGVDDFQTFVKASSSGDNTNTTTPTSSS